MSTDHVYQGKSSEPHAGQDQDNGKAFEDADTLQHPEKSVLSRAPSDHPVITVEDADAVTSHAATVQDVQEFDVETSEGSKVVHNDRGNQNDQPSRPNGAALPGTPPADATGRDRSLSTTSTLSRNLPVSSTVFVISALETINASREARRGKEFGDATQAALSNLRNTEQTINPELIFRPLLMATRSGNPQLQLTALDCIGKLISYSYFAFPSADAAPENPVETPPLIERAIEAICDCFESEATSVEIQQQVIKSLLAAILDDKIVVHGAGLLKAVRQMYNIFIYSKSTQNQTIAQGSLTQMVSTIFNRVRIRLDSKEAQSHGPAARSREDISSAASVVEPPGTSEETESHDGSTTASPPSNQNGDTAEQKLTLKDFETSKTLDETVMADSSATTVTRVRHRRNATKNNSIPLNRESLQDERDEAEYGSEDEDDIYLKDAFLIFRSLCKLSQKQLSHDQQQDLKSQPMRSKLLSLHLLYHVINNYITVFTSPVSMLRGTTDEDAVSFISIAKPHLCLSLSRNAASSVSRVYEVCTAVFWLCLKDLRMPMKKELEVFWKEVYSTVLERKNAPLFQKQIFIDVLEKLSNDAPALVEIYLNYDCDRAALNNMYQDIVENLSKLASAPQQVTAQQQHQHQEQPVRSRSEWHSKGALPPLLTTSSVSTNSQLAPAVPAEYVLRQQSLRCLTNVLASLDAWCVQATGEDPDSSVHESSRALKDERRDSGDVPATFPASPRVLSGSFDSVPATPTIDDDSNEIEKVKRRKTQLNEAIRQFNFKPKRGIKMLIEKAFIPSDAPADVARFLITNDRLDKAMLGEYLGEGDEYNVSVMHAFVDTMDFTKRRFVDALRQFLQSFRLPGEGQKIDRFMLKFAERYLTGNPNAFANADTAYVLAYSVIMLNTDLHSSKIKSKRMTPEDFIKNNRGINDGADLPSEYLIAIYDEIASDEIVLTSERERAEDRGIQTSTPAAGLAARTGQVVMNLGRDLKAEKRAAEADKMASRTELLFRTLVRAQRKSSVRDTSPSYITASSIRHVSLMLNDSWMSFLSALSSQMQDAQNLDLIQQCLEGLRIAIRITCRFDLDTARQAFVNALARFTNLGNLKEMQAKNLQALKVLIDVALQEGNALKGAWREILTCISQLDRLQLLSNGVDESSAPDVTRASTPTPPSLREHRASRQSNHAVRRPRPRSAHSFQSEVAEETRSTSMVRDVDAIFSNTARLSSTGIIDFVQALTDVSWQEIQSSGSSDAPRMYSLQKLVEISYYNMTRVRIEWSRIWDILGEHFNQVGCHHNIAVVFFALDSLRQLSMRFMELEELPGFKFQKDFLRPFEYIMANSTVVAVKDMVLRCLIQMIQARGDNIRSGWRTMFTVFSLAARESDEAIVNIAYDYTSQVYSSRLGVVIAQGCFPDLVKCLAEFSKNLEFQKRALQSLDLLKAMIPQMLSTPECSSSGRHMVSGLASNTEHTKSGRQTSRSDEEQYWYPVLMALQDVLMTGDDLEVRSRAQQYLFETLTKYGGDFSKDFWDTLWRQVLYPIFVVLQSKSEMSRAPNQEVLSVWLSTTMIQALRNMISLFTHYFESLESMLDRFLDLLSLCICQENDTIARIGSNCLQQLILQNVTKFNSDHWSKIVGEFVELFNRTTAYELFSAATTMSDARPAVVEASNDLSMPTIGTPGLSPITNGGHEPGNSSFAILPTADTSLTPNAPAELEDFKPQTDTQTPAVVVTAARRRFFNKIITSCVLQLLMIETVAELFSNDSVYAQIPSSELLRLMGLLKKSYQFAKKFNGDKELRMALWRQGFMRQPPNLLKQESGSANTYVGILMRMYHDEGEERRLARAETESALIP